MSKCVAFRMGATDGKAAEIVAADAADGSFELV